MKNSMDQQHFAVPSAGSSQGGGWLGQVQGEYEEQANSHSIISGRESMNGSISGRSSSNQMHALPVQFHLKTIMWQNLIIPPLFLILNLGTTFILVRTVVLLSASTPYFMKPADQAEIDDSFLTFLGLYQLPLCALATIGFYLMASYINPGYIIGNEELQLAKAQDYDLRHKRSKSRQHSIHGGMPGEDGQHALAGSVISSVAASSNIQQSQQNNPHQRQKSVLHKDLHLVTRHDRNKSNQAANVQLSAMQNVKSNAPPMRLVGNSETHSNYLPSQQYELANMESQPSTAQYDPMMSKVVRSSEVPGQFDTQMSLQIHGGSQMMMAPNGGMSMSDMGAVTTVVTNNNIQSTQASTIPTQQMGGLSKKGGRGGKNPVVGVKGGQKRIKTNQGQSQGRKRMPGSETDSTSAADQTSQNSQKNQTAFDMIQKRIKEANQKAGTDKSQGKEDGSEDGQGTQHQYILDNLADDILFEDDAEGDEYDDQEYDMSRPSDGLHKIQQHLQASFGKSQKKTFEVEDYLEPEFDQQKATKGGERSIEEYEPEPSARIEHKNIDGSLKLHIDQESIVTQQLSQGFQGNRAKKQYQVNNSNIIHEEGEQIEESLDFHKQNRSEMVQNAPNDLQEQPANLDDSVKEVADVIIEIDDGLPDNQGDDDSGDEDVMLFIEYKYCTICHIEQPLRCKHCKSCDHCVATHDHHCPWIGNCVGERNRFYFFWFLQCQFLQLITGLIICTEVNYIRPEEATALGQENKVIMYMAFLICTAFTLFILPLNIFHIYLACINLTSWEYLSWMRITYLKIWPKKFGSPFSKGVKGNLKMYCCFNYRKQKACYQWRMPKSLPKEKPQS